MHRCDRLRAAVSLSDPRDSTADTPGSRAHREFDARSGRRLRHDGRFVGIHPYAHVVRLIRSSRPPTDFELLKAIHTRHRGDYLDRVAAGATARVFVPVDLPAVAAELNTESDTVFGRLYFHLEPVYGETRSRASRRSRSSRSGSETRRTA